MEKFPFGDNSLNKTIVKKMLFIPITIKISAVMKRSEVS